MSDIQNGPDWWQGVDGKWYPPVAAMPTGGAVPPPPPFVVGDANPATGNTPKSKTTVAVIIGAVVVGVVLFLVVVSQFVGGSSETKKVTGTFKLIDSSQCNPDGGYNDINSSTPVVLKGKSGKELDRSELGYGHEDSGYPLSCTWTFTVKVPKGEDYYVLSVGDRGEMQYTWDEITQPDAIALTLGND